jgi:hypothetical protein
MSSVLEKKPKRLLIKEHPQQIELIESEDGDSSSEGEADAFESVQTFPKSEKS